MNRQLKYLLLLTTLCSGHAFSECLDPNGFKVDCPKITDVVVHFTDGTEKTFLNVKCEGTKKTYDGSKTVDNGVHFEIHRCGKANDTDPEVNHHGCGPYPAGDVCPVVHDP